MTEPHYPRPPVVPFPLFLRAVRELKLPLPPHVTADTLNRALPKDTRQRLIQTLKFLKLLDEAGSPEESLEQLVRLLKKDQRSSLRPILERAYPFIFRENDFDLAKAKLEDLNAKFKARIPDEASLRKARSFFLTAASFSGITISPDIPKPKTRPLESHSVRRDSREAPRHISGKANMAFENRTPKATNKPKTLPEAQRDLTALFRAASLWSDKEKRLFLETNRELIDMMTGRQTG